ncbi:glycosyltransferase [Butyrivibrio fibrisolvens]|uniref:Spore protein YkvP/CgeB glycosyl transferase-like domain-containing protein n=1 Tax=Butyrivibrio fibrisolvens TaxID=831 RepID=A0A317G0Z4_BUTFI|nr:glycosyltransferase [Butyrivibrio fibrisolvens]PWT26040.1 hypothetical protein CPT75_02370 [Butyrivibrio fibrisolvens]
MSIKILFVGDGSYPMYARAFYDAANELVEVEAELMDYGDMNIKSIAHSDYLRRIEYHFCAGVNVININAELVRKCKESNYDIVFLYSAELIFASTVRRIKGLGAYVTVYHNDNPFTSNGNNYRRRHYLKTIRLADIVYAYRKQNIDDYLMAGAKKAKLLRSYYIQNRNFPIKKVAKDKSFPRIGFIGHYEDDGRIEFIKDLSDQGIDVGVISDWPIINGHMKVIDNAHNNYNEILNKLDIAIIFLSTLNNDTYTRRCFEIPMAKTMMLSAYTDDIATMYEEDKEIVFFRNKEEFVDKALYYLERNEEREAIAEGAYKRCLKDGHEAKDRVREIIKDYEDSRNI